MARAKGCDVSYAQAGIPNGYDFVIIRLGYGVKLDSTAEAKIDEARKRNLPFALYWFLYNTNSGAEQARFAVKKMEDLNVWGHRLIFDAEGDVHPNVVREAIATAKPLLRPSLLRYRKRRRVGIYSGGWVKSNGGGTFGASFYWLADYVGFQRPAHWDRLNTLFWQFTSNNGKLDEDYWTGPTADGWKNFLAPIDRSGKRI